MKKVYLDELEPKAQELINFSQKNIKEKIDELKLLTNDFVWQGKAHDSYIRGYNNRINKIEELNNNLTKIANFLLSVKDNYHNVNEKINTTYEELLSEFERAGSE